MSNQAKQPTRDEVMEQRKAAMAKEAAEVDAALALAPKGVARAIQFSGAGGQMLAINVESKSGWYVNQRSGGLTIKAIALTAAPDGLVVVWKGHRNNAPGTMPERGVSGVEEGVYRTWFPAQSVKDVKLSE
jgi:hypothetical protein